MFDVGDKVVLVGPSEGEQSIGLSWLTHMNPYIGMKGTISYTSEATVRIKPSEYIPGYFDFFYDKRWVRHLSECVEDEFEIEDLSSIMGG